MNYFSLTVILVIGFVGNSCVFSSDPLDRQIKAKNTLRFGDNCNYETEKARSKLNKLIFEEMKSMSDPLKAIGSVISGGLDSPMKKISEYKIQYASIRGSLCNETQFLACSSSSNCECGLQFEGGPFPMSFIRQNDQCVLKRGEQCIPKINGMNAFPCEANADCSLKSDKDKECTMENIVPIIKDKLNKKEDLDLGVIMNSVTMDKYCICGSTKLFSSSVFLLMIPTIGYFYA